MKTGSCNCEITEISLPVDVALSNPPAPEVIVACLFTKYYSPAGYMSLCSAFHCVAIQRQKQRHSGAVRVEEQKQDLLVFLWVSLVYTDTTTRMHKAAQLYPVSTFMASLHSALSAQLSLTSCLSTSH